MGPGRFTWLLAGLWALMAGPAARAETTVADVGKTEPAEQKADDRKSRDESSGKESKIPRFAINSPFGRPYKSPIPKEEKRLWAASRLWKKAPEFVVEKWVGPEPEREGKFLLIEFWATWCRQCRLAVPKLNGFQRRFADDLVVVGISDEDEATVRRMREPRIGFALAIDTRARMKKDLMVKGIPHAIVVEPGGHVVWEGFPLLAGHELTEELLAGIIAAGTTKATPDENRK